MEAWKCFKKKFISNKFTCNSETNMDYYVECSILSFQDISDVSCWD